MAAVATYDEASLQAFEERITELERKRYICPKDVPVDDNIRRARAAVEASQVYSARWKWVPPKYYEWTLSERAKVLGAASTFQLCKSLLMENKKVTDNPKLEDQNTNPRFFMVIIQYESSLDVKKLATSFRKLRPVESRLEDSNFDFRIASPEDNDRITGYTHNSVTPFGLKENVPLILSADVVPLQYFWMGGGHVHLKLGLSVNDLLKLSNVKVMNLAIPRDPTKSIDED